MSPEELFLAHLGWIERLVDSLSRRCRFRREEAEDFASTVKLKLIEDDYRVFRQYQGKSKIETYLTVVVQHLLLDYQNHLWGKRRSSAAAAQMGPLAQALERLLREGYSLDEAHQILRGSFGDDVSRDELERIAAKLPPYVPRRIVGEEQLAVVPAVDGSPEQRIRKQERAAIYDQAVAALNRAIAQLPDEDRMIVRLRSQSVKVPVIAAGLRCDAKPLYGRTTKILNGLRQVMESEGVTGDHIRVLLGGE
jgi:RNA polymerase sigma factor (sigma-70 family)